MTVLTLKQAAAYLGYSAKKIYHAPSHYGGFKYDDTPKGKWFFDERDLEKFINECKSNHRKELGEPIKRVGKKCLVGTIRQKSGGMTLGSRSGDIEAVLGRKINLKRKSF